MLIWHLVQLISKGTKIPAKKIADFSDSCARVCKEHGKTIIGTAAALLIVKGMNSHMKKTKNNVAGLGSEAEGCAGDAEKETTVRKIMNAINGMKMLINFIL